MNKTMIMLALLLITATVSAQTERRIYTSSERKALQERTDENKLTREQEKRLKAIQDSIDYVRAVEAMEKLEFVVMADRLTFKHGEVAYVNSLTNFVSLSDDQAMVQVSPFYSGGGPNGVGGITLTGKASNIHLKTDKKGNTIFTLDVTGVGLSANISIQVNKDSNQATVSILPNLHSNRITLNGVLMPTDKSSIYKGRSL
ncbi:MAG: DUF4251 domain-containing protein [Bacteroides sp.]|nr:DUF4251 domain-containing protein [Bacteroides sp.]